MENILSHIQRLAEQRPAAVALLHKRGDGTLERVTYHALCHEAGRFARAFQEHCGANAIIPLYLSKSVLGVEALLGALGAGRAFAYLNRKLRAPQLSRVLRSSKANVALIDPEGALALTAGPSPPVASLPSIVWWSVGQGETPPFKKALERFGDHAMLENIPLPDGTEPFSPLAPEGCGACLFTSGSTGQPKGVLISHADLAGRAFAEIEVFGLGPEDVLLSVLPFSFDVGLNQLLSSLLAGATVVLLDSWLGADILRATGEHCVTGISGVPAIWSAMLTNDLRFDTNGAHASLRYITVSGGDLAPRQLEQLPEWAPGVGIHKTYGQTEAFRATALRPDQFAARPTSVGRPFPGVRVYVAGDGGERLPAGEEGEIVHTGLGVMMGYLDGADQEAKLRPNPFLGEDDASETAVFTGDYGYLDEEGYLYLRGRRDAMLKVAGNRVYPKEIVDQLLELEEVREAEAVGVKIDGGDSRIHAFAVLEPDADTDARQLLRAVARRLPSYMVPSEISFLDRIPRTVTGKADLDALEKLARTNPSTNVSIKKV